MFTKEQKKILKTLGITKQECYNIFGGKKFIEENKLSLWIKADVPEGTVVKMSNGKKEPHLLVMVYIFCKNGLELFTDGFFLPKELQNQGIRTRCFKAQITVARRLGCKLLTSQCSRSDDKIEFGYMVGPLLGYNGLYKSKKLEIIKKDYCKKHLLKGAVQKLIMQAEDIIDLCSFSEGLACRKEIGRTFDAEFDLNTNSKSMKTFKKHLKKYT